MKTYEVKKFAAGNPMATRMGAKQQSIPVSPIHSFDRIPVAHAIGGPVLQRTCARCEDDDDELQRKNVPGQGTAPGLRVDTREDVHNVLRSPGQPLDAATRAYMEPRFGHDFGNVRVHADALAARSAQAVNALAYTVGQDMVFAAGRYSPGSPDGQKLIAHELTHTLQQGASLAKAKATPRSVSSPHDDLEQEAERNASTIVDGGPPIEIRQKGDDVLARYGDSCSGGADDPCQQSRCTNPDQISTIRADISRAIGYVNDSITALTASPLASGTQQALDWYFNDHGANTVSEVRRRLECILTALQDTDANSRFGCHPDHDGDALAYVCVGSMPVCTDQQTNVCYTDSHFDSSARVRAQTTIHECAHRVGMSLGEPASVPDIYRHTSRFLYLDTEEALQNADSFALFAGSIPEGVATSVLAVAGLSGGFAAPQSGEAAWQARLYFGTEFQNPILGIFNPTIGIGMGMIGETSTGGTTPAVSPMSFMYSLLLGVRIADPRPGSAGGGYVSFMAGPTLVIGSELDAGAEAGMYLGYRWRWIDFSAGIGYTYDPTRDTGMEHMATGSFGITFIPGALSIPGQ